jgi:hypothetical protein
VLLDSFRRGAAHGLPVGEWLPRIEREQHRFGHAFFFSFSV